MEYDNSYMLNIHDVTTLSYILNEPASVAQLDARLTGDQEVAGSSPATFFRGD